MKHIAEYLYSVGEKEMADEVLNADNRLGAFADGLDKDCFDAVVKSCESMQSQLAEVTRQRDELRTLNPMLEILDVGRRLFLVSNRLELKYLPIYADQPDPTYITKWVWEVRDEHGASICEAHEWLYQAVDNAEAAIASVKEKA